MSLTEPLTESQELAKEIQRQDKQRRLSLGSQLATRQPPLLQLAKAQQEAVRKWKDAGGTVSNTANSRLPLPDDVKVGGLDGDCNGGHSGGGGFAQPEKLHKRRLDATTVASNAIVDDAVR